MNLLKKTNGLFYPLVIVALELILYVGNIAPNTYLVGWDNIMPELNIPLNYMRALNSVWQDYRGLGTLDGMAHAANLFHTFYIHLLSFVLPDNLLRYAYIHLTHLIGGIAFYFLALKLLKNRHGSFIAALFYLFNLGVIQMYFAPLEVFATHFASLPVMGLAILNALQSKTKTSLGILFAASLLTSPQAFVPTVFISYGIFAAMLISFSFKKTGIKRIILIAGILFVTNAFWLLPFAHTAINKSTEIKNTRINQFSSDEIYYRNAARGTIADTLTLKGFMLDTIEYDTFKKENFYFMNNWTSHLSHPLARLAQILFAGFFLLGAFLVIRFRLKTLYPFLATGIIAFIFLANNTPIIETINGMIRGLFPIFGEAFRFPFTKFITLFAFIYALLLGLGVSYGIKLFVDAFLLFAHKLYSRGKLPAARTIYFLSVAGISALILFYAFPAFDKAFTSPHLRLTIPVGYHQTFEYFKNEDPNGRVLVLPMTSFWNWEYRSWGHRGSGFLWYGLHQPLLMRPFDPWSSYNEQLYNEISTAYGQENIKAFENLLKKYDISYILVDKTVINTISSKPVDHAKMENFLSKINGVSQEQNSDTVSVYKTPVSPLPVAFLPQNGVIAVNNTPTQSQIDSIIDEANYITSQKGDLFYPLASLSTLKLQENNSFSWKYDAEKLSFTSTIATDLEKKSMLVLPSLFQYEKLIPVSVTARDFTVTLTPLYPKITLNGRVINPEAKALTIRTQFIANPTNITFTDIGQEVAMSDTPKAFLYNDLVNTLKISDGVSEEYIQVDTAQIERTPTLVELPDERIRSFSVEVETFNTEFGNNRYLQENQFITRRASATLKLKSPQSFSRTTKETHEITLEAIADTTYLDIYLEKLFHSASYAVIADIEQKEGLPVNFYVDDPQEGRPVFETKLNASGHNLAILAPTDSHSKGYGFHVGVKSVGTERASAKIKNISIYPIPQNTIEKVRVVSPSLGHFQKADSVKKLLFAEKIANFSYHIPTPITGYTILSQSYDKGWKAYVLEESKIQLANKIKRALPFLFGKEITPHVKVNNWENGWEVNPSVISNPKSEILIVYLPQYLQFAGFFLLLLPLFFAAKLYLKPIVAYYKKFDSYFARKASHFRSKLPR